MENLKKYSLNRYKKSTSDTGLQTTRSHGVPNRADNINLGKFGDTFLHGTVFASKQSLYEKEATGMESIQM